MSLSARLLPITRRDDFFADDFFQDFQQGYSNAIQDVLDKWGGRSLLADQFTNHRRAREAAGSKEDEEQTITASISDTPESYVIVLDMTAYISGEMSVRTSGFTAVVEASCSGRKRFSRRYPLPQDTVKDSVVAAMSDDGILTISVKRKPKSTTGASTTKAAETAAGTGSGAAEAGSEAAGYVSRVRIDVGETEGADATAGADQNKEAGEAVAAKTLSEESKSSSTSEEEHTLPISRRGQFFKDEFFESVWKDFDSAMGDMVSRRKQRQEQKQEEQLKREKARQEVMQQMRAEQEEQFRSIKERKREQMKQFSMPSFDKIASYRTLRSWAKDDDNQAATVTADEKTYKIVIDVKDFAGGDLNLKADDDTLTVSGALGGASFSKSFSLPGLASPEQVTASLSGDGILTITAQRRQQ